MTFLVEAVLKYYAPSIDHRPLPPPIPFVRPKAPPDPLRYHGKVALAEDSNTLFVENSAHNTVLQLDAQTGDAQRVFVSSEEVLFDASNVEKERFHAPQVVAVHERML